MSMFSLLRAFKPVANIDAINIHNKVFKFHCKITVCLLVLFAALVTTKQFFGDPIKCVNQHTSVRDDLLETYCWIHGTYAVKKFLNRGDISKQAIAYPGVGAISAQTAQKVLWGRYEDEEIVTQKYYQFICIVFALQAFMFYLPHYLWKSWEGGRIAALVKDISGPIVTPKWKTGKRSTLVQYFLSNAYNHNLYAIRFVFCELLNFCNIILQIFLMDWFLGGQFAHYGYAILMFTESGVLPMDAAFPKMTKCTFFMFGASGTLQDRDTLCILPLNIINEKLFLIMWFWFMFLLFITVLSLLYRVFILCTPSVRVYLLIIQTRCNSKKNASAVVKKFSYGDWFVLNQLGKNLNQVVFRDLVHVLGETIRQNIKFEFDADETAEVI